MLANNNITVMCTQSEGMKLYCPTAMLRNEMFLVKHIFFLNYNDMASMYFESFVNVLKINLEHHVTGSWTISLQGISEQQKTNVFERIMKTKQGKKIFCVSETKMRHKQSMTELKPDQVANGLETWKVTGEGEELSVQFSSIAYLQVSG